MKYLVKTFSLLLFCSIGHAIENRTVKMGSLNFPISCANGCYSEDLDLKFSKRPEDNGFFSGEVKFNIKDKSYSSLYDNGFVTSGHTIMPRLVQGQPKFDIFTGTYSAQKDAIWGNSVYFFDKGIYKTYTGATFDGQFYATTAVELATGNGAYYHLDGSSEFSPSLVTMTRKKGENHVRLFNRLNIIFVGTVEYNGRKRVGVFAQRDYSPGDYLTLSNATPNTLAAFIKEHDDIQDVVNKRLHAEFTNQQDRSKSLQDVGVPWGKVFAIAAGVVIADQSGLPDSKTLEFLESYTKDVMNDSTDNMSSMKRKYGDDRSADDILTAFNSSVSSLSGAMLQNQANVPPEAQALMPSHPSSNQLNSFKSSNSNKNNIDCNSMRINLDTLASSTDPALKANYENWQRAYERDCSTATFSTLEAKPSYFMQIGRKNLEQCEESNEVQVAMFCSNAMAHFYEYRSVLAKGGEQSTLNGLYKAHTESSKLYIQALEKLKTK